MIDTIQSPKDTIDMYSAWEMEDWDVEGDPILREINADDKHRSGGSPTLHDYVIEATFMKRTIRWRGSHSWE